MAHQNECRSCRAEDLISGNDIFVSGWENTYKHWLDRYGFHSNTIKLLFCHFTLKAQKPLPKAYPRELRTIGDHLRKKRLDLNLFQKDVAKIIRVDKTTIYNWENNRSSPEIKFIPRIIEFLGYAPYDNNPKTLGERIKLLRQSLGITGRELAKELGIHPDTIYGWEKGEHKPSKKLWDRFVEFFKSHPFIF